MSEAIQIFKVDVMDNIGENWFIADFGIDNDDTNYILTTNHVHASESDQYIKGPKADATLVAKLLNAHYTKLIRRRQ